MRRRPWARLPDLQALSQRFRELPTIPELWILSDLRSDGYCFGARIPETRTREEPMTERQKPTETVKSTEDQDPAGAVPVARLTQGCSDAGTVDRGGE